MLQAVILSQEHESQYEAESVLQILPSIIISAAGKALTVTCIGTGRGSSQYSTWCVDVATNARTMLHYSSAAGFPKKGMPDYAAMAVQLGLHAASLPQYVVVWGAAYYIADDLCKVPDGAQLTVANLFSNNSVDAKTLQTSLPFMAAFANVSNPQTITIRNVSVAIPDFEKRKPGFGGGLGGTGKVYGDLGTGKFALANKQTGVQLMQCPVDVDKPEESAAKVKTLINAYMSKE
jgi:hypothetical protein